MKKLLILGAGLLQAPAITAAREMGHYVLAVDMDENAPGLPLADESAVISSADIPSVLEYARRHGIDGVMTLASDRPVPTAAAVAESLGLVGISCAAAINATDKARMRDALGAHGVPVPVYRRARSFSEYSSALKDFCGRCIVKPADSSGSRGIFLLDDTGDEAMAERAYAHSMAASRGSEILVEDYMRGPEVSVETLSLDGEIHVVAVTDKLTTGAPHFVEMGHSEPSRLTADIQERILAVTRDAVRALGITVGPSHTEVIVTEEGPKIVEVGARLGGDNITAQLVPLSTGVDMVRCSIAIALGEKPDLRSTVRAGAAVRYFNVPPGVIHAVTGVERALEIPGVRNITFVKGVGDTVCDIASSTDRPGFVIARGDDAADAVSICEAAMSLIAIRVDPPPAGDRP